MSGRGLAGAALGAGLTAAHYNGVDLTFLIPKGGGGGGGGAASAAAVDRLAALVERLALDRGGGGSPSVTLVTAPSSRGGGTALVVALAAAGGLTALARAAAPDWLPASRAVLKRALLTTSKTIRAVGDALGARVDALDRKADGLAAGQAAARESLAAARADLDALAADVARVGKDAGDAADGVSLLVRVVRDLLGGGRPTARAAADLDAFAARRGGTGGVVHRRRVVAGLEGVLGAVEGLAA